MTSPRALRLRQALQQVRAAMDGDDPTEALAALDAALAGRPESVAEAAEMLREVAAAGASWTREAGVALREFLRTRTGKEALEAARRGELEGVSPSDAERLSDAAGFLDAAADRLDTAVELPDDPFDLVLGAYARAEQLGVAGRTDEAVALAEAARAHAQDVVPQLVPRGGLVLGFVYEQAGDRARAGAAYEDTWSSARDLDGFEVLAARAALGVARALSRTPAARARREEALRYAQDVGRRAEDAELVLKAGIGQAALAAEAGDLEGAVKSLVYARAEVEALDGPIEPLVGALEQLAEAFGADVVDAALDHLLAE